MIGTWIGTYRHESKRIPELRRNQLTPFTIEITAFDGFHFSGTIEDDVLSGGTRGVGVIEGKLKNTSISFTKKMPILTYFTPENLLLEESDKPHRVIYYTGKFEEGKINGSWRFKFGIGRIERKWMIFLPIKGSWEMSRSNPSQSDSSPF